MGKDLRGKELGVGISQRKDGLYSARFTSKKTGKSVQRYFKKLQECRNWYADAVYQDEFGTINANGDMLLNAWIDYIITEVKEENVKYNTIKNYKYMQKSVKDSIGNMKICDIKPIHIQKFMNDLKDSNNQSSIHLVMVLLKSCMEYAVENDLILKNPFTRSVKIPPQIKNERVLTKDEQKQFLEYIGNNKRVINANLYAIALQTGMRISEMSGLMWDDVDLKNSVLHIQRQLIWYDNNRFDIITPKTDSSIRDIPLTNEAIRLFKEQFKLRQEYDVIPINSNKFVFLSPLGNPIKSNVINKPIKQFCKVTGIENFSMHTLRHTFATRCAEAGMKPKTLQKILGHSKIETTLNIYVHLTEDEKLKEVKLVEKNLLVV